MAGILSVTESNFQEEVLDSIEPVLISFWAPWCSHCIRQAPVFDQLADSINTQAKIVKMNVDENRGVAMRQQVVTLPTIMLFKNGQVIVKMTGFQTQAEIEDKIISFLS